LAKIITKIMKREIKFRIWTGLQMEYNIMAGFLGAFYVQGIDEKDSASMSPFNTKYEDAPLMQFIGIKDPSGKEIYEGDIIKSANGIGIVKIENGHSYYELLKEVDPMLRNNGASYWENVIGNIYENPDLLK
jgi:hypothetical protein